MSVVKSGWGEEQTRFFFELTPDRVLDAVETSGLRCNGRCMSLNSFENRVYEVELEEEEGRDGSSPPVHPIARRRVVKFYRPGRWNEEQILEEHRFIADLIEAEIPAIGPARFPDGKTLHQTPSGIWYAVFPKVGGRAPDELTDEQLRWIGRLLARIHGVGQARAAPARVQLGPESYGRANLDFLIAGNWIPLEFQKRYQAAVEGILELITPSFANLPAQRVHGDCHLGNLLWSPDGPFFLDFDDMVRSAPIQDVWLLIPGRDDEAKRKLNSLLEGYDEIRPFDRSTLRLIEPLRALRLIHYTAWIARRWQDPAFPQAFPQFGSHRYWSDQTDDLEQQQGLISETFSGLSHEPYP